MDVNEWINHLFKRSPFKITKIGIGTDRIKFSCCALQAGITELEVKSRLETHVVTSPLSRRQIARAFTRRDYRSTEDTSSLFVRCKPADSRENMRDSKVKLYEWSKENVTFILI